VPVHVQLGHRRLGEVVGPVPVTGQQIRDLAQPARSGADELGELLVASSGGCTPGRAFPTPPA
jgi:hypothetical protein